MLFRSVFVCHLVVGGWVVASGRLILGWGLRWWQVSG